MVSGEQSVGTRSRLLGGSNYRLVLFVMEQPLFGLRPGVFLLVRVRKVQCSVKLLEPLVGIPRDISLQAR